MNNQNYEINAQKYMAEFQALRDAPAQPEAVLRGAGDIAAETLVDKAEAIAGFSQEMIPQAAGYFSAEDPALREGISAQFLAQAAAEMQVAVELLQISDEEQGLIQGSTPSMRSARGDDLRSSIAELQQVMSVPLSAGISSPIKRAAAASGTVESAKAELEKKVSVSALAISKQVKELGGDIAFNLVMKSEWAAVVEGAGLLNKDIAELLDKVREGAGKLVKRAVQAATKTLLNVYDKILALLGKEVENAARQKIQEWLDQIAEDQEIVLFDTLVGKMYGLDGLNEEMKICIQASSASIDKLDETATAVATAADKFVVFCSRAETLERILILAKLIKVPQVLTVIAGLQVALLAVVVYAGNDYIGYRELRFPNLTRGVGELVRINVCPQQLVE